MKLLKKWAFRLKWWFCQKRGHRLVLVKPVIKDHFGNSKFRCLRCGTITYQSTKWRDEIEKITLSDFLEGGKR